jgi:hypothetical protein
MAAKPSRQMLWVALNLHFVETGDIGSARDKCSTLWDLK